MVDKFLRLAAPPGLSKVAALRGTGRDVNSDERAAVGHEIISGSSYDILKLIYPSCYPVYDPSGARSVVINTAWWYAQVVRSALLRVCPGLHRLVLCNRSLM